MRLTWDTSENGPNSHVRLEFSRQYVFWHQNHNHPPTSTTHALAVDALASPSMMSWAHTIGMPHIEKLLKVAGKNMAQSAGIRHARPQNVRATVLDTGVINHIFFNWVPLLYILFFFFLESASFCNGCEYTARYWTERRTRRCDSKIRLLLMSSNFTRRSAPYRAGASRCACSVQFGLRRGIIFLARVGRHCPRGLQVCRSAKYLCTAGDAGRRPLR